MESLQPRRKLVHRDVRVVEIERLDGQAASPDKLGLSEISLMQDAEARMSCSYTSYEHMYTKYFQPMSNLPKHKI